MHDTQTSNLSRGGAALFRRMDVRDFRQAALWLGHRQRRRDFGLFSLRIIHVTAFGCRKWLPEQHRDAAIVPVAEPLGGSGVVMRHYSRGSTPMPETRTQNSDFNRAFGDAKKQAA